MSPRFSKSALTSRINLFYLLIFLPLLPIAYFFQVSGRSILGVFISFYGFLILLLKKDEFSLLPGGFKPQRLVGLSVVLVSFVIFYVGTQTSFHSNFLYGAAAIFYAMYIFGMFLVFFITPNLKQTFSAIFLIVAGGFSFYVAEWLEFYMEPLVPYFVPIFLFVLTVLGIPATHGNPNMIFLSTPRGSVPVLFAAGCIGIYSFLVFSIIIVVIMIEESTSMLTKVLWSIGGVVGTFAVNTLRVSLIAWVIYYFGYERWGEIHSWIGYALFFIWLGLFFVVFSKRKFIVNMVRAMWQKL